MDCVDAYSGMINYNSLMVAATEGSITSAIPLFPRTNFPYWEFKPFQAGTPYFTTGWTSIAVPILSIIFWIILPFSGKDFARFHSLPTAICITIFTASEWFNRLYNGNVSNNMRLGWVLLVSMIANMIVPAVYLFNMLLYFIRQFRTACTRESCSSGCSIVLYLFFDLVIALYFVVIIPMMGAPRGNVVALSIMALIGHIVYAFVPLLILVLIILSPCVCCCGPSPAVGKRQTREVRYAKCRIGSTTLHFIICMLPLIPSWANSAGRIVEAFAAGTIYFNYRTMSWQDNPYKFVPLEYRSPSGWVVVWAANWMTFLREIFMCFFYLSTFICLPSFRRMLCLCKCREPEIEKDTESTALLVSSESDKVALTTPPPTAPVPAPAPVAPAAVAAPVPQPAPVHAHASTATLVHASSGQAPVRFQQSGASQPILMLAVPAEPIYEGYPPGTVMVPTTMNNGYPLVQYATMQPSYRPITTVTLANPTNVAFQAPVTTF